MEYMTITLISKYLKVSNARYESRSAESRLVVVGVGDELQRLQHYMQKQQPSNRSL